MRIFPALLIVGGYLALYRRRWAPLVLTASAAGALWSLWGYGSSFNPNSMRIDIRTTLVIVQDVAPLLACILAWCDRRSGGGGEIRRSATSTLTWHPYRLSGKGIVFSAGASDAEGPEVGLIKWGKANGGYFAYYLDRRCIFLF